MDELGPGELIRRTLRENKIQFRDFAETIGISKYHLSNIINQHKSLSIDLAARIAPELGLSLMDLMQRKTSFEVKKKLASMPKHKARACSTRQERILEDSWT